VRRLRLGAFGVAVFVAAAALWLVLVTPGFEACRRHFGHDFLPFYVAGSLAREGRHADLYNLDVIRTREQHVARDADLALGDAVGPWWNPPVFAWPFAAVSGLSFGAALAVWIATNLAAVAGALLLLYRLSPQHRGLVTVLVLASAPFLQSLTHGQNTPISLLLVVAIAHAWRGGRDVLAGALTGLLLYKPQLAAAIAAVLVLHRGWRAAGGLLAVVIVLLGAGMLTMPGALSDYLHRMPLNLHRVQVENPYLWERHVTLKAFWRLLIQGRGPGETAPLVLALTAITALPFAAGLVVAARRARRRNIPADLLIASTVAAAPLLMPFYFDYDLLLLALPAVLIAPHVSSRHRRIVIALWAALYLWLFVNPYVGPAMRFNLVVPLLGCVAAVAVRRAFWTAPGPEETLPLSPELRGEGRGEGHLPRVAEKPPLTLTLSPAYRGEGTDESPRTLRKRLWKSGGAIGLFLLTLAVAGPLMDRDGGDGKLGLGYDFLPAYVAGHFARTGQFTRMYDRTAFSELQTQIIRDAGLDMDGRYGAGLNPPHFALLFAPFSALPYRTAAAVWLGINIVLYTASLVLLVRMLPIEARRDWKTWGLVPLLVTASMPFLQAAGHQQNTFLSLLILVSTVTLWRTRRAFAAGAVIGLLFYKPQLALVVAVVLAIDLGRRAVLGLGVTGMALLLLTVWAMPGALAEYFRTLPGNLDWIQNHHPYNWGRQVTPLGFARLLFQRRGAEDAMPLVVALTVVTALPFAAGLFFTVGRAARMNIPTDRLIAATIAASPLLIPYYLDYDLLLLSVPAVLFASEVMNRETWHWADRWTLRAWVGLYLWSYANPGVSGMMRLSLTVPLLAAVTAGLIARALRPERVVARPEAEPEPLRLAA